MNYRSITTSEVQIHFPGRGQRQWIKRRRELVTKYAPLVKNIVKGIASKVPYIADKEDLINVGIIGLISALGKFDNKRNVRSKRMRDTASGVRLDELGQD